MHGVYRYFLVPFDGESSDPRALGTLADQLEQELRRLDDKLMGDHALVYNLSIEELTPFYGYHETRRTFLRVTMVMPGHVVAAAKLFCRGFANHRPRQPHEAHVAFLLQFKIDFNCLGMDFVRLARVRWRGALPDQTAARPLPPVALAASRVAALPAAEITAGGPRATPRHHDSPACAATNGAGSASPRGGSASIASAPATMRSTRLQEPGFRCVFTRGRAHGLHMQSIAERSSYIELECDALADELLNAKDVRHEPLSSARSDVRLVQSLNQIWQEEAARRADQGLSPEDCEATPQSAASKRTTLPPLPGGVQRQLHELDSLLARTQPAPPPPAPLLASAAIGMCETSVVPTAAATTGDGLASMPNEDGTISQLVLGATAYGSHAHARTNSQHRVQSEDRDSQGRMGLDDGLQSDSQLSAGEASCAALLNELAAGSAAGARSPSPEAVDNPSELLPDEAAYLSGGASQVASQLHEESLRFEAEASQDREGSSHENSSHASLPEGSQGFVALRNGTAAVGRISLADHDDDSMYADDHALAALESETLEVAVDMIARLPHMLDRRAAAERIEVAVRALPGVMGVSVSESTGTVAIEASEAPWLRGASAEGWLADLEKEVLCEIERLGYAASSVAHGTALEAEFEASQIEYRALETQARAEAQEGSHQRAEVQKPATADLPAGKGKDADGPTELEGPAHEDVALFDEDDDPWSQEVDMREYNPWDAPSPVDDEADEQLESVDGLAGSKDGDGSARNEQRSIPQFDGIDSDDGGDEARADQMANQSGLPLMSSWPGVYEHETLVFDDEEFGDEPGDEKNSGGGQMQPSRAEGKLDGDTEGRQQRRHQRNSSERGDLDVAPAQKRSKHVAFVALPLNAGVPHDDIEDSSSSFSEAAKGPAAGRQLGASVSGRQEPMASPLRGAVEVSGSDAVSTGASLQGHSGAGIPSSSQSHLPARVDGGEHAAEHDSHVHADHHVPTIQPASVRPMSPKYLGYQEGCPSLRYRTERVPSPRPFGGDWEESDDDDGGVASECSAARGYSGTGQFISAGVLRSRHRPPPLDRSARDCGTQQELPDGTRVIAPRQFPPSPSVVAEGITPAVIHVAPHFSDPIDIPERPRGQRAMHNRITRFEGIDTRSFCEFGCPTPASADHCSRCQRGLGAGERSQAAIPAPGRHRVLEPLLKPPSPESVETWVQFQEARQPAQRFLPNGGGPGSAARSAPSASQLEHPRRCEGAGRALSLSQLSSASSGGAARCSAGSYSSQEGGGLRPNQPLSQSTHSSCDRPKETDERSKPLPAASLASGGMPPGRCSQDGESKAVALDARPQPPLPRPPLAPALGRGKGIQPEPAKPHGVTQVSAATPTDAASIPEAVALHACQSLTVLSLEAHVSTKGFLMPNAGRRATAEMHAEAGDEVLFVWYSVKDDRPQDGLAQDVGGSNDQHAIRNGLIIRIDAEETEASAERALRRYRGLLRARHWELDAHSVRCVQSEAELLVEVARVVREADADVLLNWDTRKSIGYLLRRAEVLGVDPPLIRQLGRTPTQKSLNEEKEDDYADVMNTGIKIIGRVCINLWHAARSELAITSFTQENVAFQVLGERVPVYSHRDLTNWWQPMLQPSVGAAQPAPARRAALLDETRVRVLAYYARRVALTFRIADAMETIPRTSELARVFGIDFTSVLTRGSQYRVESMMLRLCRTQGYAAATPNELQIRSQGAPESVALVMEPEGKYYSSPVAVLDFRSLYPSVIIAYNYCYSTCLGKLSALQHTLEGTAAGGHRFGCLDLSVRGFCTSEEAAANRSSEAQLRAALTRLSRGRSLAGADDVSGGESAAGSAGEGSSAPRSIEGGLHASPNGLLFASASTRPGVLPRLLREILETRFMVKRAMKQVPVGSALHRTLNARQFGLKLIANVTYGYTSASFSGRMPNVHIADAIVQTGRDTLQRTVEAVNSGPWGARVVYGDTDSLFVLFEGKSRAEAFAASREIARQCTELNPHPMELEMEKIYHPCVLVTKKKYCGYMYEHEGSTPKLECKGIEVIRRDTCLAERKIQEKALKLLFSTGDVSAVKAYVLRQCEKLQTGRAALNDYVFASEVRLGTYKSDQTAPVGAQVAMARRRVDPNDLIQTGERVPYIIINRQESGKLRDSAERPEFVLFPGPAGSGNTGSGWAQWVAPELNAPYYILSRIVPSLERIFSLLGVDVRHWIRFEMRRQHKRQPLDRPPPSTGGGASTMFRYLESNNCVLCDERCRPPSVLCAACLEQQLEASHALMARMRVVGRRYDMLVRHCIGCTGVRNGGIGGQAGTSVQDSVDCRNLDCPHLYSRIKLSRQFAAAQEHVARGLPSARPPVDEW